MGNANLPVDTPETLDKPLSPPNKGLGSRYIGNTARGDIWATAKRIYSDNIPGRTCVAIWGEAVVDARSTEDCPLCEWAGDIFLLCGYHEYRCCDCGAILGIHQCQCDEGD